MPDTRTYECVVIGVSAGGMQALSAILPGLNDSFLLPIAIVQHQHATSDDYLSYHLNQICKIPVKQIEEKEPLKPGTAYIAPPNYHVLIEEDRTFSLSVEERINFARPSIDVLFESASYVFGDTLIGIILTGANSDGARGLKTIKYNGGITIVQDPKTAEVATMPKTAIQSTKVDYILPLDGIRELLNKLGRKSNE